MRGGLDTPDEYERARELGFTVVPWDDLAQLGNGVVAAAVEAIGERKAFLTVDVDFVDPGFAPAVVAPEVGGPSSAQALALIRGCRGLDLAGADVVEVVPELDSSNLTAMVAATLAYELLSLMACARRDVRVSPAGAPERSAAPILRVACVQLNTRQDVAANVRAALELVEAAADQGARLVALPETWAFKGGRDGIVATAEAPDGPSNRALAEAAARRGMWLLAGSVYEPAPGGLVSNVSALFDPSGELRATYRKIHLFDVTTATARYEESEEVAPGAEIVTADVDTAGRRAGAPGPLHLLRPAVPRPLQLAGAARRAGAVRAVGVHRVHGRGALGGAAPRPGHRERLLRHRARPGGRAPAGARLLRPQHDRRPVGHGAGAGRGGRRRLRRRPGPRAASTRSAPRSRRWSTGGRTSTTADPGAGGRGRQRLPAASSDPQSGRTPARKSPSVAKRQRSPPSSEMRIMRWWYRLAARWSRGQSLGRK